MSQIVDRYVAAPWVPVEDLEGTMSVALAAAEDLYGSHVMDRDVWRAFDASARSVWIDASREAGSAFSRIFAGLMKRSFGDAAVTLTRRSRNLRVGA